MQSGSHDLARAASAYLACLMFVVAFLVTTLAGGSGVTATIRGGIVALVTVVLARPLLHPALSAVLDAMARDRANQQKARENAE